jgi:acetyl-CoA C-acetyltransferase
LEEVVIVSGVRTAIGEFGGALKDVPVTQLGSLVIKESLKKAGIRPVVGPEITVCAAKGLAGMTQSELEKCYDNWDSSLPPVQIDEVIMGNVLTAGQGQNTARQSSIYAGLPKETPAFTVNKVCGSGLKAITIGAETIALGEA